MDQGLIPRRYAKALYKFAIDNGSDMRMYALMKNLDAAMGSEPKLGQIASNPFVEDAQKVSLLSTAAGAGTDDKSFADFMKLLVSNKRLPMSREIALAYLDIYREANHIYVVEVVTAGQVSDSEMERLKSMIVKHLNGGTMEYTQRVDPELIGGFVVNIDNERLDASVSNELRQLRLKLLSN